MERRIPTKEEVLGYLKEDRNWGRWGGDDQKGAVNMVTPEKRLSAAGAVKSGRAVSLSREFPKTLAPNNPTQAIHYMQRVVMELPSPSAARRMFWTAGNIEAPERVAPAATWMQARMNSGTSSTESFYP